MSTLRDANVPFGVLMVVTETTLEYGADAVFDFFLQLGVRSYGFNAVKPVNVPHAGPATPIDHYLTPGQMTRFLADIYDSWLRHGDRDIRIREIDAVRGRLTGGPARTCTLAGGCIGQYFLIEPNGDVAHCDLFLGDPSYSLGNICRDSFATLRSSPSMQNLMADNERALSAMRSCPNF